MGAVISGGYEFSENDFVTAAKLNLQISGATISNIDRDNFETGTRPITVQGSEPTSPVTGEAWYDTGEDPPILKMYNGTVFTSALTRNEISLTNYNYTGSNALDRGDVVSLNTSTANAVDVPDTQAQTNVMGVVAEDVAWGSEARIVKTGIVRVNLTASCNIGDYIVSNGGSDFDDRRRGLPSTVRTTGTYAVAVTQAVQDPSNVWYCSAVMYSETNSDLPSGTIIMWEDGTCPTGWVACDGTQGGANNDYIGWSLRVAASAGTELGTSTVYTSFIERWDVTPSTADPANAAGEFSTSNVTQSAGVMKINDTEGDPWGDQINGGTAANFSGDHRHIVPPDSILPKTKTIQLCKKL